MSDDTVEIVEGSKELTTDGKGAVSLTKYIGVKEMLGKEETAHGATKETLTTSQSRVTELETEVKTLGEQVKQAKESGVDPEEFKKMKEELETKKTQELTAQKDVLTKAGFTEDELKDKSSAELSLLVKGMEKGQVKKPGADLGGGGGVSDLTGKTPMQLAREAYSEKK